MKVYQPETTHIEPGLLAVFQMVIGLQLSIAVIGTIVWLIRQGTFPPLPILFNLVALLMLFGYLYWSESKQRWGRAYLPVALIATTFYALLLRPLTLISRLSIERSNDFTSVVEGSSWQTFILLLVPLVLVAWQYEFKHVLLFSGTTFLLDIGLTEYVLGFDSTYLFDVISLALARTIIFALIGYIIIRMMNAQREQRQALADANSQLADYAATVEQLTLSRERNRLARELHDTLAHTLSGVSVQLEAVDSAWESAPDKARELLHKSLAQTRSGLTETRRALQALRASPLEDLGLTLAIRNLATTTAKRAGFTVELDIAESIDQLSMDVEQGVYRIVQEALENTISHANANTVRISLFEQEQDIVLEITDDGRGFDVNATSSNGHYGLQGMRERATMMNGELIVQSQPKEGTELRLTISQKQS